MLGVRGSFCYKMGDDNPSAPSATAILAGTGIERLLSQGKHYPQSSSVYKDGSPFFGGQIFVKALLCSSGRAALS
jgi:hypothetical protein